jgi:hypothetical protein
LANEITGTKTQAFVQIGGKVGTIFWISESKDLAEYEAVNAKLAANSHIGARRRCASGWPGFIRMSTPRRPDAGVPQRPRPAPDAHASLLKLPPPQIIFCAATPAPGLRPLVWVNAP